MKIKLNDSNNIKFNGTLKIYNVNNNHSKISDNSAKLIEKAFFCATKGVEGKMDVLCYDRYNEKFAKPDKILFNDKEYTDMANTYLKNCSDNNAVISKLVSIFYGFKDVQKFKNNVLNAFK